MKYVLTALAIIAVALYLSGCATLEPQAKTEPQGKWIGSPAIISVVQLDEDGKPQTTEDGAWVTRWQQIELYKCDGCQFENVMRPKAPEAQQEPEPAK